MNKPLQSELWENIRAFTFDDPVSNFPFSKKLQKENNWSNTFTANAIEEYRKFIFLCCILPNGASPSAIIDKVWHLHLTYTNNYWTAFCKNTLHQEIHHHPGKGGAEEQTKYSNLYRQTLEQYKEIFGTVPPTSIWTEDTIDEKQIAFEIYDKDFFNKTVIGFISITTLIIVLINLFKSNGADFLVYYFVLMIAGIVVSWILQEHKLKKLNLYIDDHFPKNFNRYQLAFFLYGLHRTYQTALVDLLKRDIIETTGDHYKLTSLPNVDPQTEMNPLLPILTEKTQTGNTFTYQEGLTSIDSGKLQQPELDQLTRLSKIVDYQKFIVPGFILAIGFARLFQGMANEKPIGYLVGEIGLFSLIALMFAAQYSYTYLVFKKSQSIWMAQNSDGYGNDVLNNYTLLGTLAISGFAEYNILTKVFEHEAPDKRNAEYGGLANSFSNCSSSGAGSCSGGGDGGGCGGCGGGGD